MFSPSSMTLGRKGDEMSDERATGGQSGGVNIHNSTVTAQKIVGRDNIEVSGAQLDSIFAPVIDAIRGAPPDKQREATQQVEALKTEAAKGGGASDSVMAKLVDGIVGLVPGAVGAMVSAFATPILGAVAGPITKYALDRIQGK
jgi:hypothetical protein